LLPGNVSSILSSPTGSIFAAQPQVLDKPVKVAFLNLSMKLKAISFIKMNANSI
jgi:hypothetical protein